MEDGKICALVAIIIIGLIELSLIWNHEDGVYLVLCVAAIAGLGGYVLPSPLQKKAE